MNEGLSRIATGHQVICFFNNLHKSVHGNSASPAHRDPPVSFSLEVWSKKPETKLHDKDTNKKWTASGRMGFEFLNVVHIVPWWKWHLRVGQVEKIEKAFWIVFAFSTFCNVQPFNHI